MSRLLRALAVVLLMHASCALAYRPFDSTDADVAHDGEAEIELGPVQWLREGSKRFLQAPAMIANIGFSKDRELVIEGRHEVALDREPGEPRSALVDNGVFIKQVLRRGVRGDVPERVRRLLQRRVRAAGREGRRGTTGQRR